ncbi:hypothetical protein [Planococcus sp. YIM B11945]|uniref:hypothetical protein n=1 Tax=Planococcus sp. YIM B11945 TaxID=3435410 RepID=UPI003D7D60D0
MDYEFYKKKLEKNYSRDLKDIIAQAYLTDDLGPSMGAKQLGIPRQVFVYFVNHYELRDLKLEQIKKKTFV